MRRLRWYNNAKPSSEEGKNFLDRFRLLRNDGGQAAGGHHSRRATEFPFHAPHNAIDQSHVAEQRPL